MSETPQRLDLSFSVAWEGPWHVGSGYGTATADRLVRRQGGAYGSPLVPGSQVKGVLRHHCERLAAALGCPVVSPHQIGPNPPDELLDNFGPLAHSRLLIDRLFGSRYQGGCLFVEDLVRPTTKNPAMARMHSRTSIDRVSGTARDRTLFVTEVIEPDDTSLQGRVRARHPAGVLTQFDGMPYEYALLVAGLITLDSFGGDKSTGLGRCRISIIDDGLRWNGEPMQTEAALAGFREIDEWGAWVEEVRGASR
jgi:CRISPR/Cas system CSM-associated protein Csm3 (group 7 of RAMP superfamily)